MNTWHQIPGVDESGKIDSGLLQKWVDEVRDLASKCGRIDVADMHIGEVFAQYPENTHNWPPDEICSILEEINTDSIKRNFSCAIYNKRGSHTKGVFEGGEQERELAKYFHDLASNHKNKFPHVASILEGLSKGYEAEAKREDETAEKRDLEY